MLKNILNLEGAQKLTKNEQKSISGGIKTKCMLSVIGEGEPGTPLDPSNCTQEFPVFHLNYYGQGNHACCQS